MKNHPAACAEFSENQINALIHLLSDQDPHIAHTIHNQLVAVGPQALALLQKSKDKQGDPTMSGRINAVISGIKATDIEQSFIALMNSSTDDSVDLEQGAFLIAQTAYPDIEVQDYQHQIEEMAETLKSRWEPDMAPRQAIQAMNRLLFHELGFKGNTQDYYDPDNSFLHQVLDRRKGIPISLSVLYLLVGQRLNVPIVGIGLPGHFIVGLQAEPVFIDCFNQGVVLAEKNCAKFLEEYGVEFNRQYLSPITNKQILARMLRNLVAIYQKRDEIQHAERFTRLLAIAEPGEDPLASE